MDPFQHQCIWQIWTRNTFIYIYIYYVYKYGTWVCKQWTFSRGFHQSFPPSPTDFPVVNSLLFVLCDEKLQPNFQFNSKKIYKNEILQKTKNLNPQIFFFTWSSQHRQRVVCYDTGSRRCIALRLIPHTPYIFLAENKKTKSKKKKIFSNPRLLWCLCTFLLQRGKIFFEGLEGRKEGEKKIFMANENFNPM